jgi:hypothetical protein
MSTLQFVIRTETLLSSFRETLVGCAVPLLRRKVRTWERRLVVIEEKRNKPSPEKPRGASVSGEQPKGG